MGFFLILYVINNKLVIFIYFLFQIRWEKNITLGEPPGFLHSWWCVFWDLYCAAPERRETCDHSSEAKAFHDYVSKYLLKNPKKSVIFFNANS